MIENTGLGIKSKASTKFIERTAKLPHVREGLREKKLSCSIAEV
jgi:hypothetical protein